MRMTLYIYIYIYIHTQCHKQLGLHIIVIPQCPQTLQNPVLHTARSSASSFSFQYPLVSLKSYSSCLRILPCRLIASLLSSIFLSILRFIGQFLRTMRSIQIVLLIFIACRVFIYSWTLYNTSSFPTRSVQLIFSIHLQHHFSKLPRYIWSTFRMSRFQHRTVMCPKCSSCCFYPWQSWL
jgi:hypothetical protein